MKSLVTTISSAVVSLLLVQTCSANRERLRSLEEMQSISAIVLDGIVTDVLAKKKPTPQNERGDALVSDDYEAKFKVERTLKGPIIDQSIILVYSRIIDRRFRGDNPPVLKVGDRFRLFAETLESSSPPAVIRIRSLNAVRPEAVETNGTSTSSASQPTASGHIEPPEELVTPHKPTNAEWTTTPPSQKLTSSTPWSISVVLVIVAIGLLRFVLKKRK